MNPPMFDREDEELACVSKRDISQLKKREHACQNMTTSLSVQSVKKQEIESKFAFTNLT